MYLKSLELQGFKSFPDKIKLDFNKGISAVVGPNGSGKSNIGDAMRWVMGEQSSKSLRGEKMEDVVFHGTQTRSKAGFAQVTLTIDNEDRALNLENDIVAVSRKLYRNGDSEYIINGANVRLKDISELFMDTGLGRDGYSIIGQGKIADIVSSKSTERREIFEEAAGISKFRYKKIEAQRKLVAAEDNLARLNDILSELEGRIGPLKNQSEKAKKFIILDDEKRKLEISVWVHKLDELLGLVNGYDEKLELLDSQYSTLSAELDKLENDIEDSFATSAQKSALVDELRLKIHEVELESSQAGAKIAVLENDIAHFEETIVQLNEQIEQSNSSRYFLESELEKSKADLVKISKKKSVLGDDIESAEHEFSKLENKSEKFDKSFSAASSAVNGLYLKKSEYSFKLESAKNNLSDAQEGLAGVVEEQKEFEGKSKFASGELRTLRTNKERVSETKTENENKLAGFTKLLEGKSAKLKTAEDRFVQNDIRLRETVQKLGLLRDLENSMEGFAYSVKHIMTASKQGRISGICGSVAQIISVESKYSVAIETALGGALQNIIVENEDVAKRSIRLLKESKAGRATFLPLTSVKGNRLVNCPVGEEGYVATGSELVKCDGKFSGVIDYLLGRICIVDDIDLGAQIAKRCGYKFKIVTLDGQIINAGGSFTGGSVSKNTGILTRKNEINGLEKSKEKLENEHGELKMEKESLFQETAKLNADIDGVKEQLEIFSKDELRLELEIKRVAEYVSQYDDKLDSLDLSADNYKSRLLTAQKDIEQANDLIKQVDEEIFDKEAQIEVSQNKLDDMKSKREELLDKLAQLKMKSIEYVKDEEACRLSIERLVTTLESNSGDSGKLSEKILESELVIKNNRKKIDDIKAAIEGSDCVVDEINIQIGKAQNEHAQWEKTANKLRSEQKIKMQEKETLSNEINRVQERKNSCTNDFDKLVSQLWDEHELTRSEAQEEAQQLENLQEANKHLLELRGKIKKLGNVNLGAIEEYAEVSERCEFMNHQLEDVNKSKLELLDLIDNLTENMKSMFIESFEQINKNFKSTFTEMFGGGNGELVLTDEENVLECGIEIRVNPPGKVIKSLSELSGGEQAFVAICIYFSILKISPSPFCLLDEIEAALDDVNVAKYAQYLHKFTDTTQFITITHRRGTMEEADVLYGVTMQEDGISKLLKMNLEDTRQLKFE